MREVIKTEVIGNKLTDQEGDWIVAAILTAKENAYIGNSEESNSCWDSTRFDIKADEFDIMVSIFDKIKGSK